MMAMQMAVTIDRLKFGIAKPGVARSTLHAK